MVAISGRFRRRWYQEREKRDVAELERLAAWLIALYGGRAR